MTYAIVKNVVSPARISVVNRAFLISFSFRFVSDTNVWREEAKLTCPQPSRRKTRPNVEAPRKVLSLSRWYLRVPIVRRRCIKNGIPGPENK